MRYRLVSVRCGGPGAEMPGEHVWEYDNRDNHLSPCGAYQAMLESSDTAEVLLYVHDDVTVHEEGWLDRVLALMERPEVVAVGFGGATLLGNPNLYKVPYQLPHMARGGYRSNQTDAETHGAREPGTSRVAVLDAFFMAVRRDFLLSVGGWPVKHLTHHCLDLWLACEAARAGKETWQVGVSCTHHGGGSSVKGVYQEAEWLQGGSTAEDHVRPHKWLYENYRDVLPLDVL